MLICMFSFSPHLWKKISVFLSHSQIVNLHTFLVEEAYGLQKSHGLGSGFLGWQGRNLLKFDGKQNSQIPEPITQKASKVSLNVIIN